ELTIETTGLKPQHARCIENIFTKLTHLKLFVRLPVSEALLKVLCLNCKHLEHFIIKFVDECENEYKEKLKKKLECYLSHWKERVKFEIEDNGLSEKEEKEKSWWIENGFLQLT
ncbi:conserved protein, unknown function, partial [Hepatocystis sp. ex Piliocolobus tephrosceles]